MSRWLDGWPQPRSRGFWVFTVLFFGALELVLRIKLGSIFFLIGVWVLVHHWVLARIQQPGADLSRRWLDALYLATGAAALIFAAFFGLNAVARTLDEGIRFFQLP